MFLIGLVAKELIGSFKMPKGIKTNSVNYWNILEKTLKI